MSGESFPCASDKLQVGDGRMSRLHSALLGNTELFLAQTGPNISYEHKCGGLTLASTPLLLTEK